MDSRISSVKHLYKTQNIVVLKNTDISDSWRIWLDYQGLVSLNSKVLSLCHAGASGSQVGTGERASKDLYPRIFRTFFPNLSCGPAQEVERWMTISHASAPQDSPPLCVHLNSLNTSDLRKEGIWSLDLLHAYMQVTMDLNPFNGIFPAIGGSTI